MNIHYEYLSTNGVRLHTAFAGPLDGEPVFLLHGFPDTWFGWKSQIEHLAGSGYRVIVPDQRGYNLSDKPEGVTNYQIDVLVEDVLGLADGLGHTRFYLAGHDFGAIVSWNLAMRYPERLIKLAIANVPHPSVLESYPRSHLSQLLKSWYVLFFQFPRLPELLIKVNNWQLLMSAMPEDLTEQECEHYREAWGRPQAMTSMINWYRALLRHSTRKTGSRTIDVPTLILWGRQDPHLSYEMAPLSLEHCERGHLVTFDDAAHWVMHDKPVEVGRLLREFFSPE